MRHLENYWEDEQRQMKENLMMGQGISFTKHAFDRLEQRDFTFPDIGTVIMEGKIIVGHDIGDYLDPQGKPNHRPVRILIGKTFDQKNTFSLVISILSSTVFKVVTFYEGVAERYRDLD